MNKFMTVLLAAVVGSTAGCAGISKVGYSRFDRGRELSRIAVISYNATVADRYKMWAWTKPRPRVVPKDTFAEDIVASLSEKTGCRIVSPERVEEALGELGLLGREILTGDEIRAVGARTGADAILFANVSFYLQNYLFYKTFGLVELCMRLVSTEDGEMLWSAKGRNFALFITTDSALKKLRNKMLLQVAEKLDQDRRLTSYYW